MPKYPNLEKTDLFAVNYREGLQCKRKSRNTFGVAYLCLPFDDHIPKVLILGHLNESMEIP